MILLANLCSGVAFAWNTHSEAMLGYDSAVVDLSVGESHDHHPDSDLHHGDHCCHGAAHLVGLIFNQTASLIASDRHDLSVLAQSPSLLYIAPLLRPPIV